MTKKDMKECVHGCDCIDDDDTYKDYVDSWCKTALGEKESLYQHSRSYNRNTTSASEKYHKADVYESSALVIFKTD